ncbi:hypothetical protein E2C01_038216 [Portunus trituberculatus]|uniref:Uncharacterized protein n=1 Tax=Portunus trituberculatus TaxID=210409 RepID=A0A5B7FDK7_PORTR|nr:hypothetical protein [Portunus trituberculatus]
MAADTRHQSSVDEGNGVMAAGAGRAPLSFVHHAGDLSAAIGSPSLACNCLACRDAAAITAKEGNAGEVQGSASGGGEGGKRSEEEQHGKKRGKANEASGARREG